MPAPRGRRTVELDVTTTRTTSTAIVGAGQAGLALSRHLTEAGHDHVLLERGRIGERWRSERWDSLVLLTPNRFNRLPGSPAHGDPDGFITREELVAYLGAYAGSFGAPVEEGVTVESVEQAGCGFRVATDRGDWRAANVVVATGGAAEPLVPREAASAPAGLVGLHASGYRSAAGLPDGGVLVVGAGASGQQLALELARAGRRVVLAVGRHARVPRRYRGRDIWDWLDAAGHLDDRIDEHPNPEAARRRPSLALSGANGGEELHLGRLSELGVVVVGRLRGFDGHRASFAPDLDASVAESDAGMRRVLARIDRHAGRVLGQPETPEGGPVPDLVLPPAPERVDLRAERIESVVWATGYRRSYPWLRVPALDEAGEIVHRRGVTAVPGLFVLGLRFQYTRKSHFVGGVGEDAAFLAGLLDGGLARQAA
jgi:putative flavoprotein involved in K+ transport